MQKSSGSSSSSTKASSDEIERKQEDEDVPEPLLTESTRRFTLMPIQWPTLWAAYKQLQSCFWHAEHIANLTSMAETSTGEEASTLSLARKIFASDIRTHARDAFEYVRCQHAVNALTKDIASPEARCFYGMQTAMLSVHSEVISRIVGEVPTPTDEDAVDEANCSWWWWSDHLDDRAGNTFGDRVAAMACLFAICGEAAFAALVHFGDDPTRVAVRRMRADLAKFREFAAVVVSLLHREKPDPEKLSVIVDHAVAREMDTFKLLKSPIAEHSFRVDLVRRGQDVLRDLVFNSKEADERQAIQLRHSQQVALPSSSADYVFVMDEDF